MAVKFKIALNRRVVSRPGHKPDMGTGKPWEALDDWQKLCRGELSYHMHSLELTAQEIAGYIRQGFTITACHTGGKGCRYPHGDKPCQHLQHRCNANFVAAQHLAADFDRLGDEREILDHPLVMDYAGIIYHTPSSKPEAPKMRAIFLLDTPVDNGEYYRILVKAMMWKFEGNSDPSCSDLCRLFFGCKDSKMVETGKILPLEVAAGWAEEYQNYIDSLPKYNTHYRTIDPFNMTEEDKKRVAAFSKGVLDWAARRITTAIVGERHDTLKKTGYSVFAYVKGGIIDETTALEEMRRAWEVHGRPEDFEPLMRWCKYHAPTQGLPETERDQDGYLVKRKLYAARLAS